MNGMNSNLALVDSSKAYRVSNSSGKGSPLKRADVVNKYATKINSKLSPMDQIDELALSMEKIYTRPIGKERVGSSITDSNFLNIAQKRNKFANLKEMSKSHEVRAFFFTRKFKCCA
jgi:hypothetical protein